MLSRNVARAIKKHWDLNYPFLKVKDYLKEGDIVFGNLETPLTPGRDIKTGEMVFRSDPKMAKVLADNGFSVLSLANNHSPNFGAKGLSDTFKHLKDAGIAYVGAGKDVEEAGRPVYIEKNGLTFAFLAYNDSDVVPRSYQASKNRSGTAFMDITKMTEAVKQAKTNADFVIVSMHSGTEYKPRPNQRQKQFAHAAIDSGADLVLGHHPHVVQTAEVYKGKYIFYSLGNFIFDQMFSRDTREGLMLKIIFNKEGALCHSCESRNPVLKIDYAPVLISDYAQPRILAGKKAAQILARLKLPPHFVKQVSEK
jgi:poly-gamma-glutamate synthesis protein (capsule biosynthesis protein)